MRFAIVITAVVLAASSCDEAYDDECQDLPLPGLEVHVVDATTSSDVCNAIVELRNADFAETIGTGACDVGRLGYYRSASEQVGVYDVYVTAEGYLPASVSAVPVVERQCSLVRGEVEVALTPL